MIFFVDACGKELGKVPGTWVMGQELRNEIQTFAPGCRKLFVGKKECLDGTAFSAEAVVVVSPRIFRPASEWEGAFPPPFLKELRCRLPVQTPFEWLFRDVTAIRTRDDVILPYCLPTKHPFYRCRNSSSFSIHPRITKEQLAACPLDVPRQYDIVVGVFPDFFQVRHLLAICDVALK